MAFLHCEIASESLRMATAVDVILPDKGELSEVKTLYLLHGLTDDCTGWTRYTAVERYARERGLAVVLPEVQRSFYTDMAYGLPYFTYVSEELPAVCRRMFGLGAAREQNYIFGLSMGGYGAMKCALTYPDRYAGAASFSGVCDLRRTVAARSPCMNRRSQPFSAKKKPFRRRTISSSWRNGSPERLRDCICPAVSRMGCTRQMSAFPRISRRSALRTGLTIGRARTPGTSGIHRCARRSRTFLIKA